MIESIFHKGLMLICQINQKIVCFVIIGIFQIRILVMDHIFVMVAMIYHKNLQILKILFMLKTIVHVKKCVYKIYFLHMSKREAKKLMTNFNLIDKKGIL